MPSANAVNLVNFHIGSLGKSHVSIFVFVDGNFAQKV